MKKVVSINLANYGSTGKIMRGISKVARNRGYITYQAYPGNRSNLPKEENDIVLCTSLQKIVNQKLAYYTGLNGCFAIFTTLRFLKKLDMIEPDILHLHNLHNSYINIPLLFKYIKKRNIKVVWTLHDCWAFTGKCPYFTIANCDKWKSGCSECCQLKVYPSALIDTTRLMWRLKKKWFTGVSDLTIVTPSAWLAALVKNSFLGCYNIKTIYNGIDLEVFHPRDSKILEKYGIGG